MQGVADDAMRGQQSASVATRLSHSEPALLTCIALDDRKRSPRYEKFFIFSDSPAIVARYEKALAPGSRFTLWRSDPIARKYYEDRALYVPDYVRMNRPGFSRHPVASQSRYDGGVYG